jgi:hypothetical protein
VAGSLKVPRAEFPDKRGHAGFVSNTCRVSFDDCAGMTHTVSVSASSLFEAAVLPSPNSRNPGSLATFHVTPCHRHVTPRKYTTELDVTAETRWTQNQ